MIRAMLHCLLACSVFFTGNELSAAEADKPSSSSTLWRVTIGEDATSAHFYLGTLKREIIIKIRYIWNGGCCNPVAVEDISYLRGIPQELKRLKATRADLSALIEGREIALEISEHVNLGAAVRQNDEQIERVWYFANERLKTFKQYQNKAVQLQ